jgi:hypothetical protein
LIIELPRALGNLVALQVLPKVQAVNGQRPNPALRGYLYEIVERSLWAQLAALPPSSGRDPSLEELRSDLERELCPVLEEHSLQLKELVLKPLRIESNDERDELDSSQGLSDFSGASRLRDLGQRLRLSHQWAEASVGPLLLKDQFLLTVEVVARIKCSPRLLEGRLQGVFHEGFQVATPIDLLTCDIRQALQNLGPRMTLEQWNLSSGMRANALVLALSQRDFARWLDKAHRPSFGGHHGARVEACWITESRIEPAQQAFRPVCS